jgi:hypothetical protein
MLSQLDNMSDRDIDGRSALNRGRKNGNARLVEADVHDIRRRLKAGERGLSIASVVIPTFVSHARLY